VAGWKGKAGRHSRRVHPLSALTRALARNFSAGESAVAKRGAFTHVSLLALRVALQLDTRQQRRARLELASVIGVTADGRAAGTVFDVVCAGGGELPEMACVCGRQSADHNNKGAGGTARHVCMCQRRGT
jgi:hypothetical protein